MQGLGLLGTWCGSLEAKAAPACLSCHAVFESRPCETLGLGAAGCVRWAACRLDCLSQGIALVALRGAEVWLPCPECSCDLVLPYQIRGFPTIKIFQKGEAPVDYDGGRTRSDIVSRALDLFSDNAPPPELLEVTPSGWGRDANRR